jgi:hypothetical protein
MSLTAFDPEDLTIISAHLQDAILRVGDITFFQRKRTLVVIASRFCWESAGETGTGASAFERCRCGLQIHGVLSLKRNGIRQDAPETILSLLAMIFHPGNEPPGGAIELTFSGGGSLRAEVECIEVALKDLGPSWRARRRPRHAELPAYK